MTGIKYTIDEIKEIYKQFLEYIPSLIIYLNKVYLKYINILPKTSQWIEEIEKFSKDKNKDILTFFNVYELTNIDKVNLFQQTYFYMIILGKKYLFDVADISYTDIKTLIKTEYKNILSDMEHLVRKIFKDRVENTPKIFLQEYTGRNRSLNTLYKNVKEENNLSNALISNKELYYLNPLIDDLIKDFENSVKKYNVNLKGTTIINIRGTNGSGKTTMVKKLIEDLNKVEESVWDSFTAEEITTYHKVETRKVQIWHKQKKIVMGIYNEKQTGGVDNYSTPWQIMLGLYWVCTKYPGYTIIFEGIRVSTDYKYWYKVFDSLRKYGVNVEIIGILPTDIIWAVNNVKNRRKNKNLWDLRHEGDIISNNYEILRALLLFNSVEFVSYELPSNLYGSPENSFRRFKEFFK